MQNLTYWEQQSAINKLERPLWETEFDPMYGEFYRKNKTEGDHFRRFVFCGHEGIELKIKDED